MRSALKKLLKLSLVGNFEKGNETGNPQKKIQSDTEKRQASFVSCLFRAYFFYVVNISIITGKIIMRIDERKFVSYKFTMWPSEQWNRRRNPWRLKDSRILQQAGNTYTRGDLFRAKEQKKNMFRACTFSILEILFSCILQINV